MSLLEHLKSAGIIPEVLEASFNPSVQVEIAYKDTPAPTNARLSPKDAANPPQITITRGDPSGSYTLLMVDPVSRLCWSRL